jgi:hypothetical protein
VQPDPLTGYHAQNPGGRPWWPRWLITRAALGLGPDHFSDVKEVKLGPHDADGAMAAVGRLPALGGLGSKSLPTDLTEAGLVHLRGQTQLRELNVGSCKDITGPWLAIIKDLKHLQRLHFNCGVIPAGVDLAPLAGLTDMRTLSMRGPGITDAGLAHLRGMVKMNALLLRDSRVTGTGLEHLRSMTELEVLNLDDTRVDSLAPIRRLRRLRQVSLAHTPISDKALADLRPLDQLEDLNLTGTQVTDAGLQHLHGLKKLRNLIVRGTKVSSEGYTALHKDLPLLNAGSIPKPATPRPPLPAAGASKG